MAGEPTPPRVNLGRTLAKTYFTIGLPKNPKRPRPSRELTPGSVRDRLRCAKPGDVLYLVPKFPRLKAAGNFLQHVRQAAKTEGVSLTAEKMVAFRVRDMTVNPEAEYLWRITILERAWVLNSAMSMSRRAQD